MAKTTLGAEAAIDIWRWHQFREQCRLEYPGNFQNGNAHIFAPNRKLANILWRDRGEELAYAGFRFHRKLVRIFWSLKDTDKPISIRPRPEKTLQLGNFSMSQIITPDKSLWFGGDVILTESLEYHLKAIRESNKSMGIIQPKHKDGILKTIQLGINPASIQMFQFNASSFDDFQEAVRRDTSGDWFPDDLDRKRQLFRDAGDEPFNMRARIKTKTGWILIEATYQYIENRTLAIATAKQQGEVVARPELLVA
jgi:hypothetical protein